MILRELLDWRTRAVLRRNIQVYFLNWKSAFVPPLLEPVVMFLAFGLGLGAYVGGLRYEEAQISYLHYIAPGVLTYTLFTTAFMECLYGSFVRMFYQKTFEGILGTGVERVNIIWGEIIWGAFRATLYALCVGLVLLIFNVLGVTNLKLASLWILIPAGGIFTMAFSSFALLFTATVPTIDHMNYPVFLIGIPLSLISNTYFPIDGFHPLITLAAQGNPLYHMSLIFRHFMLGGVPEVWMLASLLVLIAGNVLMIGLAHRLMDGRLEKES